MPATIYLSNRLLDHAFRNVAFTSPTTVYLGLFTSPTTDAGGGTEVTGGSYARQSISFGAASAKQIANNALMTFPTATAGWGTVTHGAIMDAVSGGNMLWHGPIGSNRVVGIGQTFSAAIGQLVNELL